MEAFKPKIKLALIEPTSIDFLFIERDVDNLLDNITEHNYIRPYCGCVGTNGIEFTRKYEELNRCSKFTLRGHIHRLNSKTGFNTYSYIITVLSDMYIDSPIAYEMQFGYDGVIKLLKEVKSRIYDALERE